MRRRPAVLLLLLVIAAASAALAQAHRAVALVTDVSGKPTVLRQAGPGPLRIQASLEAGAQLDLPQGAAVKLIFMQGAAAGRREALQGPARVQVTAAGSKVLSGPATAVRVEGAPARAVLVPGQDLRRMAGSSARTGVVPTMRPAVTGTPCFTWKAMVPGPYVVEVFDGDTRLGSWTTQERTLLYDGPPLKPDTSYFWELSVPGGDPVRERFRIVTDATRERLAAARQAAEELIRQDPQDPTPYVLMLTAYADHDFLEEAAASAREALRLRPDNADLHRILAGLLFRLGDHEGAAHETERIRELEAEAAP